MADIDIAVDAPAKTIDLLTLSEAKTLLGIQPTDTSRDAQLKMMITTASDTIARCCNRTFAYEEVTETWRELNDGTRLFLSHWPIEPDAIVSVSEGDPLYAIDPSLYTLETNSGKLRNLNGWQVPVVVEYAGGYELPDEAPPALKQACAAVVRYELLMGQPIMLTGVSMLRHKEAMTRFFDPLRPLGAPGAVKITGVPAADAILYHFMRFWV